MEIDPASFPAHWHNTTDRRASSVGYARTGGSRSDRMDWDDDNDAMVARDTGVSSLSRNVDRSLILRSSAGDRSSAARTPKGHKSAEMEAE